MKSSPSSSCFGSLILVLFGLLLIRFGLPGLWKVLVGLFTGAFYLGIFLILAAIAVVGYFTYKNLRNNKRKQQFAGRTIVSKTEELYRSVVSRLERDVVLNQVSVEELLASEILMTENLKSVQDELIRLKEFTSSASIRTIDDQIRDYQQQQRQTTNESAKQLIQENLNLIQEKKQRLAAAMDDIRQKEALVDLVQNRLLNVEEDLKFGRPVQRLFPAELYERFGVQPPSARASLPPLAQKSSIEQKE